MISVTEEKKGKSNRIFLIAVRLQSNDTTHDQVRYTETVWATMHAMGPPPTAHAY